jgi:hypothetical protein
MLRMRSYEKARLGRFDSTKTERSDVWPRDGEANPIGTYRPRFVWGGS